MNENPLQVAPLHRVTVVLSIDGTAGPNDGAAADHCMGFILGVASGDMSPFEYALLNKVPGE